jgi:hypothetical protein
MLLTAAYKFIHSGLFTPTAEAIRRFAESFIEAKCGEARRSNATELIAFVVTVEKPILPNALLFCC